MAALGDGGRGDFDLDELLGERYVQHYQRILNSAAAAAPGTLGALPWRDPFEVPRTSPEQEEWQADAAGLRWTARLLAGPDGEDMSAEGHGPDWCSASTVLARSPEICWDVCGYYALLRVSWDAGRRELRAAYLRVNKDNSREDIHFAMMILMDPVLRRAYDMIPLGGVFFADRRVEEDLRRAAAREASRQIAAGEAELVDHNDVLKTWGVERVSAEEQRRRMAADPQAQPMREGSSLGATFGTWAGQWTWFLLAPGDWEPGRGAGRRLEAWQAMLAAAFTELTRPEEPGAVPPAVRFSVGLFPGWGSRSWQGTRESCIFFLGNERPTQEMATEAAKGYLAHRRKGELTHANTHRRRAGS